MKQFLTLKYHYKCGEKEKRLLHMLCRISKNVYNCALYELRKQYFETSNICSWFDVIKIVSNNINYHLLNTYQSICIIRNAHNNMIKFMKYNKCKFGALPKYKPKKGTMPLITDQIRPLWYRGKKCLKLPLSNIVRTNKIFKTIFNDSLVDEIINESSLEKISNIYFKIPKILYDKKIRQFRIIPKNKEYYVEFTYETEYEENKNNNKKIMSIDLGINNLMTIVTEDNESFIIDGKYLKSINQYYNKQKAKYQSLLPKGIRNSKRITLLTLRRNQRIEDYLNKAVMLLINKAKELKVDKIIIGYNKGLKQHGIKNKLLKGKRKRKVNQSFVSIPLSRLISKIKLKCLLHNIEFELVDESYTSLSSFYDGDKLEKEEKYQGTIIKRGLYKRNNGIIINADINGALNIYRKYVIKSNSTRNQIDYLMSRGLTIPSRVIVTL